MNATRRCLAIDAGNTNVAFALYSPDGGELARFSMLARGEASMDELGTFAMQALASRGFGKADLGSVSICSVVPSMVSTLVEASGEYFGIDAFVCTHRARTGLSYAYPDPSALGMDRVAACVAARERYPDRDLVVVDMGTATTVDALSRSGRFMGGAILPGVEACAKALRDATARLPRLAVERPDRACGVSTTECVRSGLYYGQLGAARELARRLEAECFGGANAFVVGTGGASALYENENLFDVRLPRLVSEGARLILLMNGDAVTSHESACGGNTCV